MAENLLQQLFAREPIDLTVAMQHMNALQSQLTENKLVKEVMLPFFLLAVTICTGVEACLHSNVVLTYISGFP